MPIENDEDDRARHLYIYSEFSPAEKKAKGPISGLDDPFKILLLYPEGCLGCSKLILMRPKQARWVVSITTTAAVWPNAQNRETNIMMNVTKPRIPAFET
jgi:hypothetical protein